MKGKTRTKAEVAFQGAVASLGCIACMFDGRRNDWVSPHHISGRTKPGAHMKVIGLCGPHHQHVTNDPLDRIGIHPKKGEFEEKYGTQEQLLALTHVALKRGSFAGMNLPALLEEISTSAE